MISRKLLNAESRRLNAYRKKAANWKQWGPYLAERAWGTVREDYSVNGDAWNYTTHEHARSRAYRWNEDGLAGFCDRNQYLCFCMALWNGQDPFLKERLFGLAGPQGNHGEDVKELYWYLDSTPSHSYAVMRYRYPQAAYPYDELVKTNATRSRLEPEFEITDTDAFADNKYFDVTVTFAKAHECDILITIDIVNAGPTAATLHVVPQWWFRNTWAWGYEKGPQNTVAYTPSISMKSEHQMQAMHSDLGEYTLSWQGKPETLFTNNDTHRELLFNDQNRTPYVKDAFHRYICNGETHAINPALTGTKAGLHYVARLQPGASKRLQFRMADRTHVRPFNGFRAIVERRQKEADDFYNKLQPKELVQHDRTVQRQALAGMLWSKQLYYLNIAQWTAGDPVQPAKRLFKRNEHWQHLDNFDVISMPDKWEYPWYAVWDSAFHCLPLASVDVDFAKRQLLLMTREWYMHPNGQLPAYEWAFEDVNPPVHAWSAMTVYRMEEKETGQRDTQFLESVFHKLLLNFTWWVNRKDIEGHHIFEGGFLGLDNISLFDRSEEPPSGGQLGQADGTGWMAFFSAHMLDMALELAKTNPAYQDIATKFFEHFLRIATAIQGNGRHPGLWDDEDGMFYDHLHHPDGRIEALRVRSLVGLLPLIGVAVISADTYEHAPDFAKRLEWLLTRHPELKNAIPNLQDAGMRNRHLLALVTREKLQTLLGYMLDEDEFLSPFGIRSLSRYHADNPYTYVTDSGEELTVQYEPATSQSNMFGGNSNWRGPIWFPINYLLIESLKRYHLFYGDEFTVECPTGSGNYKTLANVADDLSARLAKLFQHDGKQQIPWCGEDSTLQQTANDGLHLFYEYFDGDTGEGLGASHQTGWTGLIAMLLQQSVSGD